MKEYNKEKLHEYAKELFALCLEKGFDFFYNKDYENIQIDIYINDCYVERYSINTDVSEKLYDFKLNNTYPIWELIEKVKQL